MLDPTGKPTSRLRASVLREELEDRLQRLQDLERWIKDSAGTDNHERIRADAPDARVIALPQPDWSLSPAGSAFGDGSVIARAIERFNAIARDEAERAGALWIDLFPLMREQARKKMVAPDGLHPSAEAYAEWARELATKASASSP